MNHTFCKELPMATGMAFSRLYSYYVPLLHMLLYPLTNENKADTDEIIQEIFLTEGL
jgi:DNA-directed RNA polymerase specialized sigma24 family protein